jgi:hypothetical protein
MRPGRDDRAPRPTQRPDQKHLDPDQTPHGSYVAERPLLSPPEPFPISLSRVTLGFRRRRTISSVRRGACEGAGAEFIGGARGRA